MTISMPKPIYVMVKFWFVANGNCFCDQARHQGLIEQALIDEINSTLASTVIVDCDPPSRRQRFEETIKV
ncbi:hypothetical protein [Microvirga puerhi]|uniref:Uncharacterized protein n=1 Tax=Microvirga puerhi TaxID=2876078 RepID=A0ABS7VRM0_9HYPH|nr:hypothetical protein [Microvirga puerhi]MBZ6078201.1 hypothetical protein [Microvirga puerhi]